MDESRKSSERRVAAAIGVLLIACAVAIVAYADDRTLGVLAAALAVAALGVDALLAAARGRRSLLSRIGPLP